MEAVLRCGTLMIQERSKLRRRKGRGMPPGMGLPGLGGGGIAGMKPPRECKYTPKAEEVAVVSLVRNPLTATEWEELYERAAELVLVLSRLCRQSRSFGGSLSARVEQPAFNLVRVIGAVRAPLFSSVISSEDLDAVDWLEELEQRTKDAALCIGSLAASGFVTRAVRGAYYKRQLGDACEKMRESLARLVRVLRRHLTPELLQGVKMIMGKVQTYYRGHERQRDMRVRDHKEAQMAAIMDKHVVDLHHLVLARSKLNRKAHDLQQERCRALFHRMGALGVDQPRDVQALNQLKLLDTRDLGDTSQGDFSPRSIAMASSNASANIVSIADARASAQVTDKKHMTGVRLEPLEYSPRLIDRKQANVDKGLQAQVRRYQSIPCDSRLDFNMISNHNYKWAGCENGIDASHGTEMPSCAGIEAPANFDSVLPQRAKFDDFWVSETHANDLQQLEVLNAIGALSCKSVSDTVSELRIIERSLGFPTGDLERIAKLERAADKKLPVAYLRPVGSSENTIVSLGIVPLRGRKTRDEDDEYGDTSDGIEDKYDEYSNDENGANGDQHRPEALTLARMDSKRRPLSWPVLTKRICQALRIKSFAELRHRDSGVRVAKASEVCPGQVVMVNAIRDTCYAALQTNVCRGDIAGVLAKLALFMDEPVVVADCCRAATKLVQSDDYQGSADSTRHELLKAGGLGALLVIAGRQIPATARGLTNEAANALAAKGHGAKISVGEASTENRYGEQAYVDATAAALQTLAALARWVHEPTRLELLDGRAAQTALKVIQENPKQPEPLRYACELLASLAEIEQGRLLIGQLMGPTILPQFMVKCPVKRSFQPAQFSACNALANLLVENADNAAQLAGAAGNAGLHYICDVVTRVPGNVKVYAMACAALGRLAVFEPWCFTSCKNKGLLTLLHSLSRFPESELIQCHVLVALAECFQKHPKIIKEFVHEKAFDKVKVSLSLYMNKPWADVQWRALMALTELVRRRRFIHESVYNGILDSDILGQTALLLKRAIRASTAEAKQEEAKNQARLRLLGQEAEGESINLKTITWVCKFVRLTVRSCSKKSFTGVRDENNGAYIDETDAELEYPSDVEEPDFDSGADVLRAKIGAAREAVRKATQVAESISRAKGESLTAYLKRQGAADEVLQAKEKMLGDLEQETRLPPLELRKSWGRTMKRLHDLRMPSILAEILCSVAHEPVAARECMRALYVWLEFEPVKTQQLIPCITRGVCKVLRLSALNRPAIEYAVEIVHMVAQDLCIELDVAKEKRRLAEAATAAELLEKLHGKENHGKIDQGAVQAKASELRNDTFQEGSVFADIFGASAEEKHRPVFVAETAPAALLRGSPEREEFVLRALNAFDEERALESLKVVIERYQDNETLSSILACANSAVEDALLFLDEAHAFKLREQETNDAE